MVTKILPQGGAMVKSPPIPTWGRGAGVGHRCTDARTIPPPFLRGTGLRSPELIKGQENGTIPLFQNQGIKMATKVLQIFYEVPLNLCCKGVHSSLRFWHIMREQITLEVYFIWLWLHPPLHFHNSNKKSGGVPLYLGPLAVYIVYVRTVHPDNFSL